MPPTPEKPTYAQHYLPRLQAYQAEMIERLATLVNIDSGTGQVAGINETMKYLEQWLRSVGFTVNVHSTEPFGNNLLARYQGSGGPRILLVGHVDTVYGPGSAQKRPFDIHDGLAYGPGVIDMKSGVIMGIYALRVLLEAHFDAFGEIYIVFNNDEEVGSAGSTTLLRDIAHQVDYGLVLEPSHAMEAITHTRKGADKYILEVRGISAHSGSDPQNGRSAVIELAHKMIAVHHLNALLRGVTFNVTRLSSTEPLNIIPDMARCHVSVRAFTQQGLDKAASMLEQIAAGRSIPDTHTTLTRTPGRRPYQATPEVLELVSMAQAEGQALGTTIQPEPRGGVSDANLLMEEGVPTLDSLGPIGSNMHNLEREHLHVESLAQRGALLAGIIQRLCLAKLTGDNPSL
ncbi:MAG TPA: M20 family metallopeptidase [Ktedonobacteraceae bacterium]